MFHKHCGLPCIQMEAFTTVSGSIKDVITPLYPGLSIILHGLYMGDKTMSRNAELTLGVYRK